MPPYVKLLCTQETGKSPEEYISFKTVATDRGEEGPRLSFLGGDVLKGPKPYL